MAWGLLHPDAMLIGLVLLVALLGLTANVSASEYDPPRLYDVEYFKLSNGFDVVLKKQTHARNVAVRLAVNVGFRHFPCNKRETPHFLEHLLSMGTSKHSEAELKRLTEDHGGAWNGLTSEIDTIYTVDIGGKHLPLAINTVHEIITDTIITPKNIDSAREVIYRERGGKHFWLMQLLYQHGFFKHAATNGLEALLPGTGVYCRNLISPAGIGEADVKGAYNNYYVPANMALVVVGKFDRDALVPMIESTFGKLAAKAIGGNKIVTPPYPQGGPKEVSGTLSPLIGTSGEVALSYRTDGSNSPDDHALFVLSKYLDRVIFARIRIKEALSYGPGAGYGHQSDYGVFLVNADVNLDKMELVRTELQEEIDKVKRGQIDVKRVDAIKESILEELARSYDSNSSVASYYISNMAHLKASGKLIDHESLLASVTSEDIQRVANKYLGNDSRVTVRSTPTMTYTQFYIGLGVLAVTVPGAGFVLIRRFIKRRRATGETPMATAA
jgi:zinc protease